MLINTGFKSNARFRGLIVYYIKMRHFKLIFLSSAKVKITLTTMIENYILFLNMLVKLEMGNSQGMSFVLLGLYNYFSTTVEAYWFWSIFNLAQNSYVNKKPQNTCKIVTKSASCWWYWEELKTNNSLTKSRP